MTHWDTIDNSPTISGDGEGQILGGRYQIIRQLGAGGMGVVYLAQDMELDIEVAVKVLPAILTRNPRAIENLRREARTALKLTQPNIVRLHTFQSEEAIKYLVMEYIDGGSLEEKIAADGRLEIQDVLKIFTQVAAGLDYAHSQNVLHRDIKPANIMLTRDGRAKLADFGIARQVKDSMTRITGQQTSGTLVYMAPEQFRGDEPDTRSDVYSLAASLYECLTGHPPFWRGAIEHQILNEAPAPADRLSAAQNEALLAALSKSLDKRPANAKALMQGLGVNPADLNWKTTVAGTDEHTVVIRKSAKRRLWPAALAAMAIIAILAAGTYWGIPRYRQYKHNTLQSDLVKAQKAAAAGNMKLVLDLSNKYSGNSDFTELRMLAFEAVRKEYLTITDGRSDRDLNKLINRRVQVTGNMVHELMPQRDGTLWSCIQMFTATGDYRYVQLRFPQAVGTQEELEKQGLVKGNRIKAYGFLEKVESRIFRKNEYGLNPVEAWEIIK